MNHIINHSLLLSIICYGLICCSGGLFFFVEYPSLCIPSWCLLCFLFWGQSKNHYNEAFIYNIRLMLFIVFWFLACSYVFHSSPTDNALFSIIFFAFGSAFFNSVIGWNVFRNRLLHCANVILGISLVVHFLHSFGIIGASPYYFRTGEDYVMSLLIFHTEWGEISTPIGSIYRFSSVFWEAGQAQIVVFFILMLFTDDLKNHLFNS